MSTLINDVSIISNNNFPNACWSDARTNHTKEVYAANIIFNIDVAKHFHKVFIFDVFYLMDTFKKASLTREYVDFLRKMEAIFYPIYPSQQNVFAHFFEPSLEYIQKMQIFLGEDFYDVVKRDRTFIKDHDVWNKHRELLPYLFEPYEQSRMQSKLVNDYDQFMHMLYQGAPIDVAFVDEMVDKYIDTMIDIKIYRQCIAYASVEQFFCLLHSLQHSKKAVPHIKMLVDQYPEYTLALDNDKIPFYYVVAYGVEELLDLYIYADFEIFDMSLDHPSIALYLADKVSGFDDQQANVLLRKMIRNKLQSVCRQFAKLFFVVDFDTQRFIMDDINFFYILKDKFDLCGVQKFVIVQECIRRYRHDKSLRPMVEFYKSKMSAKDIRVVQNYSLKF